jgi:cob(I)alamin adenosyltransferase
MAIYTKTGDKGTTKVFNKKSQKLVSIGKDSSKIKSIGSIDELNSFLGVVKSFSIDPKLQKRVEEIQSNLFIINSILAGSKLRFSGTKTKKLEKEIDKLEGILPVQKNFIYYGGGNDASLIFYTRSLVRRAERSLVSFAKKEKVPEAILTYFNRLSDYLFILGRSINFKSKIPERNWKS